MGKWIHLRIQHCQNYWFYQKIVQVKLIENWISYKKVSGRIYLSPPWVELRGSKDILVSNIRLYWNRKIDSLLGRMLPKLRIISKNCSNKSCSELNFLQKVSGRTCLSPPGVELWGPKNCHFLNIIMYWKTWKWVHLRAQRCQIYRLYQNIVQIKVVQNWISYISQWAHMSISGAPKVDTFQIRGEMLQKLPIISKNASNKSCTELNFLKKTQWTFISYLPWWSDVDGECPIFAAPRLRLVQMRKWSTKTPGDVFIFLWSLHSIIMYTEREPVQ